MNNILKVVKPKEIRRKMLIANYDLTKNTSICPAQELKKMVGGKTLYGEITSPDLSNIKTAGEQWGRILRIDKSREVIKLSNITIKNKIVNMETMKEVKADYVYSENHFIRLYVYADVEITNKELAKECNITLDDITFSTRSALYKRENMDILKNIFTYDVAERIDMEARLRIKDISFDGYRH